MEQREKKWFIHTKRADFETLGKRLGIDPLTVRILRNRGLETEDEMRLFLYGDLSALYDEKLLPDAPEAAALLFQKIREGRHIRIVGDYDIDGVCASYILLKGLQACCAHCDVRIPDRIRDGYGINIRLIREAAEDGVDTILTCDNGIAAVQELKEAKELGMTVIVTDHHDVRLDEAGEELLPPADLIVDAKRRGSRYPTDGICGAVAAWKLLRLLYGLAGLSGEDWLSFLEFAAIATVGDVMELQGENRIIVREGLKKLNKGPENTGLRALIAACGLEGKQIGSFHIGFVLGPCINAGGRLETAELAMAMFLEEDEEKALSLALQLKELNDRRKEMTEKGAEEALRQAEELYAEDKVLVIYLPGLHESLAGIVAGRVKEATGKPSFVITDGEQMCKGSGRSVEAWNMFEGLCGTAGLLQKFGGHPMAAGISLLKEDIPALRAKLNENCSLTEDELQEKLWIDAALPLEYISMGLLKELEALEPFGNGNEKPLFALKDVRLRQMKVLGKNRNVLRMDVVSPGGFALPAVMFCRADGMLEKLRTKESVSILYYPSVNEYGGNRTIQLILEGIR